MVALGALAIYVTAAVGVGRAAGPQCNGLDATVGGATQGPDTLVGTAGDDVIAGLGGDDTLVGRGGDDTICGDAGTDDLLGGAGDDTLIGHNRDPGSGTLPWRKVKLTGTRRLPRTTLTSLRPVSS